VKLLSSMFVSLALLGCASSSAYRKAHEADTPDAYRAFLAHDPKDQEADAARERLAQLEFQRACSAHTIAAYKRFLDEFSDSSDADAARARLETLRFTAAEAQGTAEAYRQFLGEEPSGAHHADAQTRLAKAEASELGKKGDVAGLAATLSPDDPRYAQVQAQLDDHRFEEAKASGAAKLLGYLKDFPAGAHRQQVEALLLSRKIDGLLFSGLLDDARLQATRSPLASQLPGLDERLSHAAELARALSNAAVQPALASDYLRPIDDLLHAAHAPDPLDRWEAVEELGQTLSIAAIDPLLESLRAGRNTRVRETAFESLARVFAGLPHDVADYELATRLATLRTQAASPDLFLSIAVLEQIGGDLGLAAIDYGRAAGGGVVDPVLLRRVIELRREKGEAFSSAVAARQLSLWARSVADETTLSSSGGIPLASARDLCAAREMAHYAAGVISDASHAKTEFPEDLAEFSRLSQESVRMVEAKLADAEILLRTQDHNARTCDDRRVTDRLVEAAAQREKALEQLPKRSPALASIVLSTIAERDPDPRLRTLARARLAAAR
jgi:hypothetical protein